MAKKLIFSKKEIKFLETLVKNQVEFMLVGLSAAALQGAPVVTQDIDLWFKDLSDPNLHKTLKSLDASYIPPFELYPPSLAGKGLELFDIVLTMHGLDNFNKEKEKALWLKIDQIPIPTLPLKQIIASKEFLARDKDQRVLQVLKDTLKTQKPLWVLP